MLNVGGRWVGRTPKTATDLKPNTIDSPLRVKVQIALKPQWIMRLGPDMSLGAVIASWQKFSLHFSLVALLNEGERKDVRW